MFKLEKHADYQKKISEDNPGIIAGDEIYFGKEVRQILKYGVKILDVVPCEAKVLSTGYNPLKKQPVYLLQCLNPSEPTPFFIFECNLLKYGAFLKGVSEETKEKENLDSTDTVEEDQGKKSA